MKHLSLPDSICLITSLNPSNRRFGTGFVIHKDKQATYIVTCAHVIDDVDGAEGEQCLVRADDRTAQVIALSPDRFPDLAVLKVAGLFNKPALRPSRAGYSGSAFVTAGWFKWSGQQHLIKGLQGELGKHVALTLRESNERVKAWDLKILDEDTLEPGYSGSPVLSADSGHVLGVVSDRQSEGKRGLAISIAALQKIWPDMPAGLIATDAETPPQPPRMPLPNQQEPHHDETWHAVVIDPDRHWRDITVNHINKLGGTATEYDAIPALHDDTFLAYSLAIVDVSPKCQGATAYSSWSVEQLIAIAQKLPLIVLTSWENKDTPIVLRQAVREYNIEVAPVTIFKENFNLDWFSRIVRLTLKHVGHLA